MKTRIPTPVPLPVVEKQEKSATEGSKTQSLPPTSTSCLPSSSLTGSSSSSPSLLSSPTFLPLPASPCLPQFLLSYSDVHPTAIYAIINENFILSARVLIIHL